MKYQIRRNLPKSLGGYTEGQIVTLSDEEAQALLVKGLARSVEIKGVPKKKETKPVESTVEKAEKSVASYRSFGGTTKTTSEQGDITDG